MVWRQHFKGFIYLLEELFTSQVMIRVDVQHAGLERALFGNAAVCWSLFVVIDLMSLFHFSDVIDADVYCDSVQPGVKSGGTFKLVQVPVGFQEGLLDQVHGVFPLSNHTKSDREKFALVSFDKILESGFVAILYSFY